MNEAEPLASIVKRLGNPESTTLLYSPCQVFQIPQVDGAIGYHQINRCAVVIGDPICLPEDSAELTKAFHLYCQERGLKTVYLLAGHDFAHWAINNSCRVLIQLGSELSINPIIFQKRSKLRWKVHQSIKHDVYVKEYDPRLEKQMQNTLERWSKERRGAQIYLGGIDFFNKDVKNRIFYAQHNEEIIGILVLTPVDRFQGWVMNSCLTMMEAPEGTSEHLICSASDILAEEHCSFLCLGMISGRQLGEVVGLTPFGKSLVDLTFKMARWFFKLDAKALYLHKYHPNLRSTFLLAKDNLTISELLAIKHVLNVRLS